jgi:hypothetical protein
MRDEMEEIVSYLGYGCVLKVRIMFGHRCHIITIRNDT